MQCGRFARRSWICHWYTHCGQCLNGTILIRTEHSATEGMKTAVLLQILADLFCSLPSLISDILSNVTKSGGNTLQRRLVSCNCRSKLWLLISIASRVNSQVDGSTFPGRMAGNLKVISGSCRSALRTNAKRASLTKFIISCKLSSRPLLKESIGQIKSRALG